MNTRRGFREPPPPSLKSSRGRSRGVDGLRGLGGARKGSCRGFYGVCTVRRERPRADTEAISERMDADCTGGPRRLWVGGQTPPARPRGCSTPARNGAAEPRASALYIAVGAEPRRSCAPPGSRLPPPPLRVLARSRACGSQGWGAGPPLRGSFLHWSACGMTSHTPSPGRPSPGRRVPHRAGAARHVVPMGRAVAWRPGGLQAPSLRVPRSPPGPANTGYPCKPPFYVLRGRRRAGGAGRSRPGGEPENEEEGAILAAARPVPGSEAWALPNVPAPRAGVARRHDPTGDSAEFPRLPCPHRRATGTTACAAPTPPAPKHTRPPARVSPAASPGPAHARPHTRAGPARPNLPLPASPARASRRLTRSRGGRGPRQARCPHPRRLPSCPSKGSRDAPAPTAGARILPTERCFHRSAPGRRASRGGGGGAALPPSPLPSPPPAGRLRGGAGAILGAGSPPPPAPGCTGRLGTRGLCRNKQPEPKVRGPGRLRVPPRSPRGAPEPGSPPSVPGEACVHVRTGG